MEPKDVDLSVDIGGIHLNNPVMPASGCFGYGEEFSDLYDISLLGAVVTKGTTLEPREGNPQPRSVETTAGMINFIGLENPGARFVVEKKLPFLRKFAVPVIVNISGRTADDYIQLAAIFDEEPEISGLEVNISCPNVKAGGIVFGQSCEAAKELVAAVRARTSLPLIVKLTPNVTDVVPIARAVIEAEADAVSLVNTFKARAKIKSGPDKGKWIEGGLSGPCIKPIALRLVSDLAKAKLGVPIIGIGGIMCLEDALDFFESGASAVQIGTGLFKNPLLMLEIIEGLRKHLADNGFASFREWKKPVENLKSS